MFAISQFYYCSLVIFFFEKKMQYLQKPKRKSEKQRSLALGFVQVLSSRQWAQNESNCSVICLYKRLSPFSLSYSPCPFPPPPIFLSPFQDPIKLMRQKSVCCSSQHVIGALALVPLQCACFFLLGHLISASQMSCKAVKPGSVLSRYSVMQIMRVVIGA